MYSLNINFSYFFTDQEIDFSTFVELDNDMLKEIVPKIGHRMKILLKIKSWKTVSSGVDEGESLDDSTLECDNQQEWLSPSTSTASTVILDDEPAKKLIFPFNYGILARTTRNVQLAIKLIIVMVRNYFIICLFFR